jgi:hypothetical protein
MLREARNSDFVRMRGRQRRRFGVVVGARELGTFR